MIGEAENESKIGEFFKEYRQEIKFIVTFALGVSICFFIIHREIAGDKIIYPITVAESVVASKILHVIGYPNKQEGNQISGVDGNPWRMEVKNNCNGVYESIIFLMAFIAIQVPWKRKWKWMLFGFALFHTINEMRLVSLFIIGTEYSHGTFKFFHETFWQYALILFTLGIFLFCAHRLSATLPQPEPKEDE